MAEQTQTQTDATTASSASVEDAVVESQEQDVAELESSDSAEPELQKSPEELAREAEGFKKAMEAERHKRQAAEEMLRRAQYQQQQPQQPQEPVHDPNDYLTAGETDKYVNRIIGQKAQEIDQRFINMSMKLARKSYDDFDDVFKLADELSRQDPMIVQYVANSPDPGETAYRIGLTHPEYQKSREAKVTKKVAQKINAHTNAPATLSNASAGNNALKVASFAKTASDEEYNEYIAKVKMGQLT